MPLSGEINDGKPAEGKTQARVALVENAGIVRSAMGQRITHPVEKGYRVFSKRFSGPKACNSTHAIQPGTHLRERPDQFNTCATAVYGHFRAETMDWSQQFGVLIRNLLRIKAAQTIFSVLLVQVRLLGPGEHRNHRISQQAGRLGRHQNDVRS